MHLFVPVSKIPKKKKDKHILKKIAGNVDNGPRKTAITLVDVLDSRGNLTFDLPETSGEKAAQHWFSSVYNDTPFFHC